MAHIDQHVPINTCSHTGSKQGEGNGPPAIEWARSMVCALPR